MSAVCVSSLAHVFRMSVIEAHFNVLSELSSTLLSMAFATWFVASLYIWPQSASADRDSAIVIRRRFFSVFLVCTTSILVLYFGFYDEAPVAVPFHSDRIPFRRWIGVHGTALLQGALLPLLLFLILFAGPLVHMYYEHGGVRRCWRVVRADFAPSSLTVWRNYVVGPFSEELVFRALLIPCLLGGGHTRTSANLLSSVLFGGAHLHHVLHHMYARQRSMRDAMLAGLFQFTYTTLFGSLIAYVYVRTGHMSGVCIVHAFCNYMGVPGTDEHVMARHGTAVRVAFVGGLVAFLLLLNPLTEPSLYDSVFYDKEEL